MKKKDLPTEKTLGDFQIPIALFAEAPRLLKEFSTPSFKKLSQAQQSERVNRKLLELIEQAETPCFLLPAVLDYMDRVHRLKLFDAYALLHFELWLNQSSGLSDEENLFVRGKIMGKWIPRDAYQVMFPIGMGKTYPGSHVVTAHSSPDLDTTVASFWGWVDAFAARVAKRLHLWNVPGGPPASQTEIPLLFSKVFGENVFEHLTKTRTTLGLSGIDLMTQKGMELKGPQESLLTIDHQGGQRAIVLVDEQGRYLGDWRSVDVEGVREVITLLNNCLRWFQSHLHTLIVALFAKEKVSAKDLPAFFKKLFSTQLKDCAPVLDYSDAQVKYLHQYLTIVLGVKKGVECTFEELAFGMKQLSSSALAEFRDELFSLSKSSLFDKSGHLIENRPRLFSVMEKLVAKLDNAIESIRSYVVRFDVALKIKTLVFERSSHPISARAEVEEIRSKMNNYTYLTVTQSDEKGNVIPLGIIPASDVHKNTLGTVTLRDFCNRDETKIPSYFEVISVIDHHKSHLQTSSAPMVIVSDAQSSNVLCAELAFQINDAFSIGSMSMQQIEDELKGVAKDFSSTAHIRRLQRLLGRLLAAETRGGFFIDPVREYVEYLHFLYAILDDTDLLTKVSIRDLECVVQILNRLKSIMVQKEVETLSLSDLPRDSSFLEKAARRILQNRDMYSLYSKIYLAREEVMDQNIMLCAKKRPSAFFVDTKEQNNCVRVGQTKLFARNILTFTKNARSLAESWYEASRDFHKSRPEVDLYLQMISTVASADDLYAGNEGHYKHQDEIWIWIPFSEVSIEHLKSFLNGFRTCPQVARNQMSAEFYAAEYEQIFSESFLPIPKKVIKEKGHPPIAILKFNAGTLNSRKAMITPFLPKIVE